jgi:hypothetical protein
MGAVGWRSALGNDPGDDPGAGNAASAPRVHGSP